MRVLRGTGAVAVFCSIPVTLLRAAAPTGPILSARPSFAPVALKNVAVAISESFWLA